MVSDRDCRDDGGAGDLLPAGDQGSGYQSHLKVEFACAGPFAGKPAPTGTAVGAGSPAKRPAQAINQSK
ncbi:hypothetical protein E4195_07320 [Pseudomonas putida]|nr:hypothetical protein E4195_07320 [Pseudomonas putida]